MRKFQKPFSIKSSITLIFVVVISVVFTDKFVLYKEAISLLSHTEQIENANGKEYSGDRNPISLSAFPSRMIELSNWNDEQFYLLMTTATLKTTKQREQVRTFTNFIGEQNRSAISDRSDTLKQLKSSLVFYAFITIVSLLLANATNRETLKSDYPKINKGLTFIHSSPSFLFLVFYSSILIINTH